MIAHGWFPFFFIPFPMPYWAPPPYYPPPPPPAYYGRPPVYKDTAPHYGPPGAVQPGEDGCPIEECPPPDARPSDGDPYEGQTHIVPGPPSKYSPQHPRSDGMPVDPPMNSRWYYEPGHPSFPNEK